MRLLIIIIILFTLNSSCKYFSPEKKITATQIQAEELRPFIFINIEGNVEPDRITCMITNNATVTGYKNIAVSIHYFTDTHELIRSEDYILETTVAPKTQVKHIIAVNPPPNNFNSVYFSIKKAEIISDDE